MHTKLCKNCKVAKPATSEFFHECRGARHRLESRCRPCYLAYERAYRERNKDAINNKRKSRYVRSTNDGRLLRGLINGKPPTHKVCSGPCGLERAVSEFSVKYVKKNNHNFYRSSCKLCERAYSSDLSAHRRAQKLKATPAWLTLEHLKEIKLLYLKSKIISKETGTQHQVDHIVPLLGKEVCGLHVPWNLRVITAEENRKKCNKLESTVVPKPSLWD